MVPTREGDPRRSARVASWLGLALGVSFAVCFATGLWSHLVQSDWFDAPAQPAGLYRVTQGLHVATGIATIPLLLAKLWAVYPELLRWPPVRSVAHALERISLVPLVAGAIFLLMSGVANIDLWYPLPLFFPAGHHWVAWITVGALVVHVGAKVTTVRGALGAGAVAAEPPADGIARRRFLAAVAGAGGVLTVLTVGQTVSPLRRIALLAPRDPAVGSQGFPVNRSAVEADVVEAASDAGWRLQVTGAVAQPLELTLGELQAMPRREATLPIACVEGWSASRRWGGVALRDLLARAGATPDATVTVRSLDTGLYGSSTVGPAQAADPDTLLALTVDGEALSLDHGYPLRLIGPGRPGVAQTKWLTVIEVGS